MTFFNQRDIPGILRREARHEIFSTPELVTARRSILGPPAEGRPGPSNYKCEILCRTRREIEALEAEILLEEDEEDSCVLDSTLAH